MLQAQRFVIEVDGEAAGLVVRTSSGFRFYASRAPYTAVDGSHFRSVAQAENACRRLLRVAQHEFDVVAEAIARGALL